MSDDRLPFEAARPNREGPSVDERNDGAMNTAASDTASNAASDSTRHVVSAIHGAVNGAVNDAGDDAVATEGAARHDNPYAAPQSPQPADDNAEDALHRLRRRWLKLLLINAVIPSCLGMQTVSGDGVWGMPLGLLLAALVGLFLCRRQARVMTQVCDGAGYVALTQLLPFPHLVGGMLAMWIFGFPSRNPLEIAAVTFTMATMFSLMAFVYGDRRSRK